MSKSLASFKQRLWILFKTLRMNPYNLSTPNFSITGLTGLAGLADTFHRNPLVENAEVILLIYILLVVGGLGNVSLQYMFQYISTLNISTVFHIFLTRTIPWDFSDDGNTSPKHYIMNEIALYGITLNALLILFRFRQFFYEISMTKFLLNMGLFLIILLSHIIVL